MVNYKTVPLGGYTPQFKIRYDDDSRSSCSIFDVVRRKWVALTPEEWVRQNIVAYLLDVKHVPMSRISVETAISLNGLSRRCDAIVYDFQCNPLVILEFKAQSVPLTQKVFDQVFIYNSKLKVPYLFVSNGLRHIFCTCSDKGGISALTADMPDYDAINRL